MNLLHDAPQWARFALIALLLAAAAQDIVQRRISNWLCLGVIVAAGAAAIAVGPTLALWQNALLFALLLAVSLPAFAKGWLGGGDVKLLAELGLWVNFATVLPLLACIFIAGGVIAALSLAIRHGAIRKRGKGVPYGVAIAIGTGIVMLQPALFQPKSAGPLDLTAARATSARR